jgi:hypothetical protein
MNKLASPAFIVKTVLGQVKKAKRRAAKKGDDV